MSLRRAGPSPLRVQGREERCILIHSTTIRGRAVLVPGKKMGLGWIHRIKPELSWLHLYGCSCFIHVWLLCFWLSLKAFQPLLVWDIVSCAFWRWPPMPKPPWRTQDLSRELRSLANRNDKRKHRIVCVDNVKPSSRQLLIIVEFAIDAFRGWTTIVRGWTIVLVLVIWSTFSYFWPIHGYVPPIRCVCLVGITSCVQMNSVFFTLLLYILWESWQFYV